MFVWRVSNRNWSSSLWSWISFSVEAKLVRSSTWLVPSRSASHKLQYQWTASNLSNVGRCSCSISANELCHYVLQLMQWNDFLFFLKFWWLHLPHLYSGEEVDLFRVMNLTSKQFRVSYATLKSQHWKHSLRRRVNTGKPVVSSSLLLF